MCAYMYVFTSQATAYTQGGKPTCAHFLQVMLPLENLSAVCAQNATGSLVQEGSLWTVGKEGPTEKLVSRQKQTSTQ